MKTFRSISTLVILVASVVAVRAQNISTGFAMPKMMTLMLPEVKKEIKLTKDQEKKIQDAMKDMQSAPPPTNFSGGAAAVMGMMDGPIASVLSADQMKRLTELWIQHEGPVVLRTPEIGKALELTDDQKAKIEELGGALQQKMSEAMKSGIRSKGDVNRLKKIQEEGTKPMVEVLTEDQKKKFDALQGAKFKFRE